MNKNYRICKRCIMDTSDPDIQFDENGVCNHCYRYDTLAKKRLYPLAERPTQLNALVDRIKRDGKGKEYDCVIGVSGGVDSTYIAYLTQELGLRPIAVHFDNGWNSELAVTNIEKTLKRTNIDLLTYVVNWEEFRDLQVSFLKASTPDGEVPTDHAIVAQLYRVAAKLKLRNILLGVNVNTESVLPRRWGYGYSDFRYISAVHKKFGTTHLRTYPHYNLFQLFRYMFVKKIELVPILDYIDYQKQEAMATISDKLGWVYYGGKHYESIYTRFYQSQVLVQKFGIDKRRAHTSNLILSGQMTRDQALVEMERPPCPEDVAKSDKEYVLKKLNISVDLWENIMNSPVKYFSDYPNTLQVVNFAKRFLVR